MVKFSSRYLLHTNFNIPRMFEKLTGGGGEITKIKKVIKIKKLNEIS